MNRLKKAVIVTRLARKMREKGSWCGETHLQKALYLAQELLDVPTGFDFILYKHGPFSFDLRDELTALRADNLLTIEPQHPYGPRLATTPFSKELESRFPKTIRKIETRLDFIADRLHGKGVVDLERLATALYVIKQFPNCQSLNERALKLNELKPHVSISDAEQAIEEIGKFQVQAETSLTV